MPRFVDPEKILLAKEMLAAGARVNAIRSRLRLASETIANIREGKVHLVGSRRSRPRGRVRADEPKTRCGNCGGLHYGETCMVCETRAKARLPCYEE
jgi:hypothetical protein